MDGSDSEESRHGGDGQKGGETASPVPEGAVIAETSAAQPQPQGEAAQLVQEDEQQPQQERPQPRSQRGEPQQGQQEQEKASQSAAQGSNDDGTVAKEVDVKVGIEAKREDDGVKVTAGDGKPSYTLHIRNVPDEVETSELEVRLMRFGEVVSINKESGVVIAKFSRTNDAYAAKEKLDGLNLEGSVIQVTFGPQDPDHYNRGKRRTQGRGRKEFLDAGTVAEMATPRQAVRAQNQNTTKRRDGANGQQARGGMRAWEGEGAGKEQQGGRKRAADGPAEDAPEAKEPKRQIQPVGSLAPPNKHVSRWSESLSFEEQLEDFMKMPRHGMYNRYLVLGKLPPELRTGEAIWRMVAPVQRDILQIEMLTCFGKPVAHVALRSATAAAAMHRLAHQLHPNLTVAFAPPRRASATVWLGNVDDFCPRKDLESMLNQFGKVINGLRYLPARTCAFATFSEVSDAIAVRNTLYGMEIQKNQYLNLDFVDEAANEAMEAWGPWGMPWGPPPPGGAAWGPRPWGPPGPWAGAPPPPWGPPPRGRGDDRRGHEGMRGYPRSPPRDGKRARRNDRSRSPRREPTPEKGRRRAASPPARGRSDSEAPEAPRVPKVKVKLYKMGEFCCNIVANYVRGKEGAEGVAQKLHIDQRTKIDHCKSHFERAGALATIWHFSAADRNECAAYDALCDYFVEKQRVGLVQTPSYYVYIVPPIEAYLKELKLPASNFVVGLQIPIKK